MKQYHDLLKSILEHGKEHQDRTGVGTISHFGYQTRFDLSSGFPIVTPRRSLLVARLFGFSRRHNEANSVAERGVGVVGQVG